MPGPARTEGRQARATGNAVTRQRLARALGLDVTHRLKEAPTVMTPHHRLFPLRARRQDGFTLIELLVVIVILGVLSAIVVFSVRGIGDKGRKEAVAADAATLRTAEEAFCAKHGRYGTIDDLKADGLLTGEPQYNMVAVGEENKCGRGENSSYALYDTSPTVSAGDAIQVGAGPADLAVDEKTNRIYVASSVDNSVTVIDGKTDKVIGTPIKVSNAVSVPTRIAVNTGTGQVYVGGTGGLAIIDTANGNQVIRVDGFFATVSGLAVSPENGDVYVGGGTGNASVVAYIAAGTSTAKQIPLPAVGLMPVANGVDFAFDVARHTVYLAKSNVGTGTSPAASIGLFAISTQSHEARLVVGFPTVPACSAGVGLQNGQVRGSTAIDPNRNLVYLLAKRCVTTDSLSVATVIAINPTDGTSTPIDDPVGAAYTPQTAVYNAAAGSVYVFSNGGAITACGNSSGRISRIRGTTSDRQAIVCGMSPSSIGNTAHKVAVLKDSNRIFVAQTNQSGGPGGLGIADGTTMLTQSPLGAPRQFAALAVNNTTAKTYAVDQANGMVAVFRTGSA